MREPDVGGVGYEGRPAEEVLEGLRSDGVTTVADVRLTPLSRKRGLSKRALEAALEAVGIRYVHLPALGNPRDNRAGFADLDGPDGRTARERYRTILATPDAREALDRIRILAADGRVAILCFEADERRCHRALVLDAVRGG